MLILSTLRITGKPTRGSHLRNILCNHGHKYKTGLQNRAGFYQLMRRLEQAELVTSSYTTVCNYTESQYELTALGKQVQIEAVIFCNRLVQENKYVRAD